MKKNILLTALLLILFASCSNLVQQSSSSSSSDTKSSDGNTWLVIKSADIKATSGQSRAANGKTNFGPSQDDADVSKLTNLVLKGKKHSDSSEAKTLLEAAAFSGLQNKKIMIEPGNWDFTLSGKLSDYTFTGSITKEIVQGVENTLSFVLKCDDEYGSLELTIEWTNTANKLVCSLRDAERVNYIKTQYILNSSFEEFEGEADATGAKPKMHRAKVNFTKTNAGEKIPSGTYYLRIEFDGLESDLCLGVAEYYVTIANGLPTRKTITTDLSPTYKVEWELNGGEFDANQIIHANISRKTLVKTMPKISKPGYFFDGWYDNEFFTGSPVTSIGGNYNSDVKYYAKWHEPVLYVSETGNDSADGLTTSTALKTIDRACDKIADYGNSGLDWIINISGSITGKVSSSATGSAAYTQSNISINPEYARSILITGQNSSAEINRNLSRSTNSTSSTGTVLIVDTSVPVTIKNLKLTKGHTSSLENPGGALRVTSGSTVTLGDGLVIYDNYAGYGGGVYNAGTLYINGTALIGSLDNEHAANGYDSNSYSANYGNYGGGIYNVGNLYLGYSEYNETKPKIAKWTGQIRYNYSGRGGAIYNTKDGVVVMNSGTLSWNASGSSGDGGGAVYNLGSFTMQGDAVIEYNCSNDKNGGGVFNKWESSTEYGTFTMAGGQISKNETTSPHSDTGHGGGVFNSSIMYVYGDAIIGDKNAPTNEEVASSKEYGSNYAAGHGGGICVDGSHAQLYLGYGSKDWTGGIYYNYASDETDKTGGGGLAVKNSATVIMKSGTIAYNGTNKIGDDVYLGSNNFTFGGSAKVIGEIEQYSSYTFQIDDALGYLSNNAITLTPCSDTPKTEYYSNQPVIALTNAAKNAGVTLSTVIPKFYITPLVETATGKETKWHINPEDGKIVINSSAGISAALDVSGFDIVVKKNSTIFASGQLLENPTGSFTLTLYSAGGVTASGNSDIHCMWRVDGEQLEAPQVDLKNGMIISPGYVPAGIEYVSDKSITITCTSTTNGPTISPGVHDIALMVYCDGDTDIFTLQIKK